MAETMRAWRIASPGSLSANFRLVDDAPRPSAERLKKGQMLVKVAAAGLNPADYKVVEFGLPARAVVSFPKTLGMDLAGTVVAVADDANKDVAVGDKIMGRVNPLKGPGTLSEYVIVEKDGYGVLPKDFDAGAAAGAPTAGLTAYQSIKPWVQAGDRIFINGGSGGTGVFGIQIAKALGLHVTTSCSTGKVALCRELGADEVIDYKTTDIVAALKEQGQVYALIVDNVGSSPQNFFSHSGSILKKGGHFVGVGGEPTLANMRGLASALFRPTWLGGVDRKYETYVTANSHADLSQLASWLGDGTVKTVVDSTFGFEEAAEAFAHLKKGSSAGKVVVKVGE